MPKRYVVIVEDGAQVAVTGKEYDRQISDVDVNSANRESILNRLVTLLPAGELFVAEWDTKTTAQILAFQKQADIALMWLIRVVAAELSSEGPAPAG